MKQSPRYSLYKNSTYALKGLLDIIQSERSFQLELMVSLMAIGFIIWVDLSSVEKVLLFFPIMVVLICECINAAVERTVDLVTQDFNRMAGRAKDAASAAVFLSFIGWVVTWAIILIPKLM